MMYVMIGLYISATIVIIGAAVYTAACNIIDTYKSLDK